jgi:hypothetical protein
MIRILRTTLLLGLITGATSAAWAFALLGPFGTNQVQRIGYNARGTDIGGPMLISEGYRWNVPILTYAYDRSFLYYFGSNGVAEVDKAFALLNSYSTNLTNFSADLSEIPLEVQRENYLASQLSMYDLKSVVIGEMITQLGLASAERYVWCLRDRRTLTQGNTTYTNYIVETRNFDPVTLQPTSYVNGVLYTYTIYDQFLVNPDVADSVESMVDPLAFGFGSISSAFDSADMFDPSADTFLFLPGRFFTGLTRDDVAGLRYLYRPNNYQTEQLPANVDVINTNTTVITLLTTTNLTAFLQQTRNTTNNPAAVLALYPDLNLTYTNTYLTNLITTNQTIYLTNKPWMPAGTYIYVTNETYTTNVTLAYDYQYDNVKTNHWYPQGILTKRTFTIKRDPWSPASAPYITNYSEYNVLTNFPSGDIYIVPSTNLGYSFVSTQPQLVTLITVTNSVITNLDITIATNNVGTNGATNINVNLLFSREEVLAYSTNYTYAIYPIEWQNGTNATQGLRGGVGGVRFMRVDYNSLVTPTFTPITNYFTDSTVTTNNTILRRQARIRVTAPDIIFTSQDLGLDGDGYPWMYRRSGIDGRWVNNSGLNSNTTGSSGPGVIQPQVVQSFANIGQYLINYTLVLSQTESSAIRGIVFGSFDGSTNQPVVYPANGDVTLRWLEQQILQRP